MSGALIFVALTLGCRSHQDVQIDSRGLAYPESPEGDVVDGYHGVGVPDPYRWLESLDSAATQEWIAAQNRVSATYLEALPARAPFLGRLQEMLESPPPGSVRKQGRFWVSRQSSPGSSYRYLVQEDLDAPPRVVLDPQALDLGPNEQISAVRISPDGRYAAYTVSSGGKDLVDARVRDLVEDRSLDDRIPGLKFDMPYWTADSRGLVYWKYRVLGNESDDGVDRESYVAFHALGTPSEEDVVLARSDPEDVGATTWSQVSDDGRFLVLFDDFGFRQRLSVLDLADPLQPKLDGPFVALSEERQGDQTFAGSVGSTLFFRTTRGAPLGRMVAIRLDQPQSWTTVIPETEHLLQHALVVGGRLVLAYREHVQSALRVFELDGTPVRKIDLPAPGSTFWYGGTPDSPVLTFFFDAYAHPRTGIRHDVATGETSVFAPPTIELTPGKYVSRQVFYTSVDGTRIPLFLTHRADLEPDGDNPTLLHGYGAAGAVSDPMFADDWFAWIEAGGILAVANIRGGGEYGEAWHEAGMLATKQNTFDDFIAAAEYLIAERYTSPEHLAILGYSNGGMLVGAVMTQRPELFAAALPVVGVLDALRFPSFTAGPRWARDMGDPAIVEQFEWLRAWSPLHGLREGACYPATLIATAQNDDLVHPSQSYKFAARLQAVQSCDRPVILRAYELGGHRFWVDRDRRDTNADLLAFAARHTGLKFAEPKDEGFQADRLARLTDDLREGRWGNVHALLISRHGRLLYEEYFEGSDEILGDSLGTVEFGPNTLHDVRSISKTVTALLVGIALDTGLVSSVDTPLAELLPDHRHLLHGPKSELTLRHVLSMSTGLQWDEDTLPYTNPQNDERRLSVSDDPVSFVLSRDLVATPGETFQYSAGATLLLARILDRATGESLDAYARRVLFEPLGITHWQWSRAGNVAPSPYSGLRLTARDLAKIGEVFASGGSFVGRRIVSEAWVRQATRAQISYDDEETPDFVVENGYGFQMWWNRYRFPTGIHEVATGVGNGEQRIIVVPHLSLVVTVLGGFYNDPDSGWLPEEILMQEILPALKQEGFEPW